MAIDVPRPPGSRRIPAEVWDAAVEAEKVRAAAERAASVLLGEAQAEAEAIRARAVEAGRAEGLAQLAGLAESLLKARELLWSEAEPQLVQLAFSIAQRILALSVERDPEAVVQLARRAVQAVRHHAQLKIHAHPDDLATLQEAMALPGGEGGPGGRIALIPDAQVERGGVLIETELGTVDVSLGAQLDALRQAAGGPARR
jgi:flagellar biosynthesis/type III secretory pathway protein FliH